MNIFFDLDGTLINSHERYYRVYADLLIEKAFKPLNRETYLQFKRTKLPERSILEFSKAAGIYDEYYLERTHRMEEIKYLELDTVWPELNPVIHYLSKKTCTFITLRMNPKTLMWELNSLGIKFAFSLVLQTNTGFGTPITAESIIRIMRENLPYSKMDSWIIGDTHVDIRTGQ